MYKLYGVTDSPFPIAPHHPENNAKSIKSF
jgi:hypothetical protein